MRYVTMWQWNTQFKARHYVIHPTIEYISMFWILHDNIFPYTLMCFTSILCVAMIHLQQTYHEYAQLSENKLK